MPNTTLKVSLTCMACQCEATAQKESTEQNQANDICRHHSVGVSTVFKAVCLFELFWLILMMLQLNQDMLSQFVDMLFSAMLGNARLNNSAKSVGFFRCQLDNQILPLPLTPNSFLVPDLFWRAKLHSITPCTLPRTANFSNNRCKGMAGGQKGRGHKKGLACTLRRESVNQDYCSRHNLVKRTGELGLIGKLPQHVPYKGFLTNDGVLDGTCMTQSRLCQNS